MKRITLLTELEVPDPVYAEFALNEISRVLDRFIEPHGWKVVHVQVRQEEPPTSLRVDRQNGIHMERSETGGVQP